MSRKNIVLLTLVIIAIVLIVWRTSGEKTPATKIGVITPLTGGAAYWGESTLVGVHMAEEELANRGVKVSFIVEDGQLDPKVALNAAQKLTNIDRVRAIYSEFNPASITVASFLKDTSVFHLYDSAATSPLSESPYNFKTYLDYQDSCRTVAHYIKNKKGISRVGVLKMNIEHGDLCVTGIKEVYGEQAIVESYNPGTTDFKTSLQKLNLAGADAIFHASFQPETLTSLRQLQDLGITKLYVGLAENITPDISAEYAPLIEGDIFFGLPQVGPELMAKIKQANNGKDVADYNAAALAFTHLTDLGKILSECGDNNDCVSEKLGTVSSAPEIGFEGFENRVAKFNTRITEWRNSKLIEVN